jgi:hypothetical protein
MNRFNTQTTLNMMGTSAPTGTLSTIQVGYGCNGRFTIYGNAAIQTARVMSSGYTYTYSTTSPSTSISFTTSAVPPPPASYTIQCLDSFGNIANALAPVNVSC